MLSFCSRTLTPAERNYSVTEKECLAVIFGIEKNRQYLEGFHFTVLTDHSCLRWLLNLKDPSGRLARWALRLQPYDFSIEYRKGSLNSVADALSRIPTVSTSLVNTVGGLSLSTTVEDEWYTRKLNKVKANPDLHPDWKIHQGELFHFRKGFLKGELQEPSEDWKLVVPFSRRASILFDSHDHPQAGHLGVEKTHWRVGRLFYWPGMYQDVVKYIRKCDTCQKVKPPNSAPEGLMQPRYLSIPWDVVSMDIMGPFPRSSLGNVYLLVFEDVFTKWIEMVPIRRASAEVITSKFCSLILNRFGCPRMIVTDNGKNFVCSLISALAKSCGISHQKTPYYHSQANPTERSNRNIKQLIVSYLKEDHTKWDKFLGEIQFALNSVVQESTKFSPAFLNFGREPRPVSSVKAVQFADDLRPDPSGGSLKRWADRIRKIDEVHHLVETHLLKSSLSQSSRYNLRRRPCKFVPGDLVLRRNMKLSSAADKKSAKLFPSFEGPFKVVTVSPSGACKLQDGAGKSAGLWHASKLKIYTSPL